jgi:hypothetical protein
MCVWQEAYGHLCCCHPDGQHHQHLQQHLLMSLRCRVSHQGQHHLQMLLLLWRGCQLAQHPWYLQLLWVCCHCPLQHQAQHFLHLF